MVDRAVGTVWREAGGHTLAGCEMITVIMLKVRLFLMVRGMKVGSHVNLSPTQVYFFSIKTKPYRGCEKMKMSLMFRI